MILNICQELPILILVAFITGNSSLEPLIEGLYAQIHVIHETCCGDNNKSKNFLHFEITQTTKR